MTHRYIGKTGLRVSPICLGTMTFGSSTDKKEAFRILDEAFDKGVNFFDTAELYPVPPKASYEGTTEIIVGEWLKTKQRDSIILASKVSGAASGWFVPPTRHGLTAVDSFHIKKAIENSLKKLDTDYLDLYQMHWPDAIVPIEESLKAFDELVREGKVRYLGTSNDTAYGLTKANETAKNNKIARFESIQNNFSLINPRALDEISTICKKENISLLPYSPIGAGMLSGKYNNGFYPKDSRFGVYMANPNPRVQAMASKFVNEKTILACKEYVILAKELNISPVTLAVAWTKQFDFVASTIIGARKVEHLEDSLKAMDLVLTNETMDKIKKIQKNIMYAMG